MWEQISPVLMSTLTTIIIAAIGLLGAYALSLIKQATEKIKAETNKINDETQRKLVQDALDRVSNLAQKTVQKIEQTSAAAVREAVKDGKVNREELLALGKTAFDEVYGQLSADTVELISTQVVDIQAYVEAVIEAEVLKLKK
jgi:enoyl-CoA hydratase/carnithine racemase